MLPMSSTLSTRLLQAVRPAVRQLARITANVLLAYAWAGLWLFVMMAIAERFDPEVTGILGLVGSWVWTMFWLLIGAPFVIGALAIIDLTLYRVADARMVGRIVALIPGAAATPLALAGPGNLVLAVWLIATGLAFGQTMRLPPPARPSIGWR